MKRTNPFSVVAGQLGVFLLAFFWISIHSHGQTFAYKAVLDGLYDEDFPVLRPEQILRLSDYQILDTREKEEYDVSHLAGAKWVGYDTFDIKNVAGLDRSKPVLVYCTVGARSQEIGKKLQEAGFSKVYNLYGGIIHWSNEEKPLQSNGYPTRKVHTYSKSWSIWLTKGEKVY